MSSDPNPTSETVSWGNPSGTPASSPDPWGGHAPRSGGQAPPSWHAFAVLGVFLVIALIAAGTGIALGQRDDDVSGTNSAAPLVGQCRTYDAREGFAATSNDSPVLPCTEPHTAQTFAVSETMPAPGSDNTWTEDQVQDAGEQPCSPEAAASALGLTDEQYATKRIAVFFFVPNQAQAKAGARWVRCDATVISRGRTVELEGDLEELARIDGAFTRCVRQLNAFTAAVVTCEDRANQQSAIGVVDVTPGSGVTDRASLEESCANQVDAVTRVDDPQWEVTGATDVGTATKRYSTCWLRSDQWDVDRSAWPQERPYGAVADQSTPSVPDGEPSGGVVQA